MSKRKHCYAIKRPNYPTQQFPLIRTFYFTGEDINPWRCECCLTKRQRENRIEYPILWDNVRYVVCRKCGLMFD